MKNEHKLNIKKGYIYYCIEDVILQDGTILYTEGETYVSEEDDCITDDSGDELHGWNPQLINSLSSAETYFIMG